MGLSGKSSSRAYCLELIEFHLWRSNKVCQLLSENAPTLWEQSLPGSFSSLNKIVNHLVWAEQVWFERSQGRQMPAKLDLGTEELLSLWPKTSSDWLNMVQNATDAELDRSIAFKDSKGDAYTFSLFEIVVHLMDHATYHVGQIMNGLRSFGIAPPSTNYIHYLRAKL